MEIQKVYIGGWFQRTTLHLTEVWNFLHNGTCDPYFTSVPSREDAKIISTLRHNLGIKSLRRIGGPLEVIEMTTSKNITVHIAEDGLIILERPVHVLKTDLAAIKSFYDDVFSSAFSFPFKKGAPVPKELAN